MKKRILQFTVAETKGGRTQYILNVWNHIDKSIFQFDFITFSKNKLDFENELINTGANVYYISCHPEEDMERFISEFGIIISKGYDIIEIHTSFWVSTIVEKMAQEAKIPKIIIHAHSTGINAALDKNDRERHLALHNKVRDQLDESVATYYWACSNEAAKWLYGDRIPIDKIEIIHNTIDTNRFRYDIRIRERERDILGLEYRFVVGISGRLEKVKNVSFAIQILQELKKEHPQVFLLIVGDGSLRSELEKQCIDCGLMTNDVLFTGLVDNVSDYLQVMDVYLLPSFFEGFPISILEAQCCGLYCITSMATPSETIATDNVSRLPLNKTLWVKECKSCIEGYERRDQSKELAKKGFDTKDFIQTLEGRYLE